MINTFINIILPNYALLCWLLYVLVLLLISWQTRLMVNRFTRFSEQSTLKWARVFFYSMCMPCVVIYDWRAWLVPAVPTLFLAIANNNIAHLLSALFSALVMVRFVYWYRANKADILARRQQVLKKYPVLKHVLNSIQLIGACALKMGRATHTAIIGLWQK